jgi:hypothetical protein
LENTRANALNDERDLDSLDFPGSSRMPVMSTAEKRSLKDVFENSTHATKIDLLVRSQFINCRLFDMLRDSMSMTRWQNQKIEEIQTEQDVHHTMLNKISEQLEHFPTSDTAAAPVSARFPFKSFK